MGVGQTFGLGVVVAVGTFVVASTLVPILLGVVGALAGLPLAALEGLVGAAPLVGLVAAIAVTYRVIT